MRRPAGVQVEVLVRALQLWFPFSFLHQCSRASTVPKIMKRHDELGSLDKAETAGQQPDNARNGVSYLPKTDILCELSSISRVLPRQCVEVNLGSFDLR